MRESHGESLSQAARAVGVTKSAFHRWELGNGPRAEQMLRLLAHYPHDVDFLLFGDAENPEPQATAEAIGVLSEFMKTTLGRLAVSRGIVPVLSSIQFKNTPDVQTYARVARALLDYWE